MEEIFGHKLVITCRCESGPVVARGRATCGLRSALQLRDAALWALDEPRGASSRCSGVFDEGLAKTFEGIGACMTGS